VKLTALLIPFVFTLPLLAHATLGEPESSVDTDQAKLKATHKLITKSNYSVHEMTANGNTIREYVNASGIVFAVAWRGIKRPDLSTLFGSYFPEYKSIDDSATVITHGRAPISRKTSQIVVNRGGHMRDIHGQAYLPTAVPPGVNTEELQ
jgi:Protein of unknown function (DUF2844)